MTQVYRRSVLLGLTLLSTLGITVCSAATTTVVSTAAASGASAAAQAAKTAQACTSIGDFYWEIGDRNGVKASGQVGDEYDANTEMRIASASKWVFGAYVLEKIGKDQKPSADQVAMLEMRSGFTEFSPIRCLLSRSVESCMDSRGNDEKDAKTVGKFSYGGGHSQRLAVSLGLGRMSATQLTTEVKRYLGTDLGFSYDKPQLAGGMVSTPSQYGQFLRKIMSGKLRMHDFLGYEPTCTQCSSAVSSPAKKAWHYSLNHWVEDAAGDDGAFSSPGLLGFYPWISADKSTYGIVAREKLSGSAYWDSVQCGKAIRSAWEKAN